jgi:hypothetical protein
VIFGVAIAALKRAAGRPDYHASLCWKSALGKTIESLCTVDLLDRRVSLGVMNSTALFVVDKNLSLHDTAWSNGTNKPM